jgi:hypothetical protein
MEERKQPADKPEGSALPGGFPPGGRGHRKADNDARELRDQAEACRRLGQHDLARQLEAFAAQLELGGNKPRKKPAEVP